MKINETTINIQAVDDIVEIINAVSNIEDSETINSILGMFSNATNLDFDIISMCFGNILGGFYSTSISISDGSNIIFNTLKSKILNYDIGDTEYDHNGFYVLKLVLRNKEKISELLENLYGMEELYVEKDKDLVDLSNIISKQKQDIALLSRGVK